MPFTTGQTAIVVPLPAAEPVVDRWRQRYDDAAPLGVPAHVTVLYPFLDIARIDDPTVRQLRALCAAQPAFSVRLERCGRFPGVLYLDPGPAEPFRELTAAVVERWPEAPPYGGAHAEVVPHLTVAHGVDDAILATVEQAVAARLPVTAEATAAHLLTFDGSRWTVHTRLAFGQPRAADRSR